MARKPSALARELLRNFPKGKRGGRGTRRRGRKRDGAGAPQAVAIAAATARQTPTPAAAGEEAADGAPGVEALVEGSVEEADGTPSEAVVEESADGVPSEAVLDEALAGTVDDGAAEIMHRNESEDVERTVAEALEGRGEAPATE